MKLVDIFKYAFNSLGRHKKRTALTLLGIMVGVTAFTSINSLNVGFQRNIKRELTDAFGANTIIVAPKSGATGTEFETMFDNSDLEWVRNIDHVESVTGVYGTPGNLTNAANTPINSTLLVGTDIKKLKDIMSGIKLADGSFPANDTEKNNSLYLGNQIQHYTDNETFAEIGEEIQVSIKIVRPPVIREVQFNLTMKGYLEETTQSFGTGMSSGMGTAQLNPNKMCFLPRKVLQDKLTTTKLFGMIGKADDHDHVDGVGAEIKDHFGEDKVKVITSNAILSRVTEILDRIAIFLLVIASVALLVAGFGIMNTMTMSVSERTKEIGILKSIGATNRTVLGIFLSEALIMGVIGGLLGIGLGYAGGYVLGRFIVVLMGEGAGLFRQMLTPILTPRTVGISLGISTIISILFAYWPSKRAANYDPVKALRFG